MISKDKQINVTKQSEIVLQGSSFIFVAALDNSYCFCHGIIVSGKLCDYEYLLINVLFVKTKEMSVKKLAFISSSFFSAKNILRLFKNRSRRARVDQNDIKFVSCMKNWFLGFIIPLKAKKLLISPIMC